MTKERHPAGLRSITQKRQAKTPQNPHKCNYLSIFDPKFWGCAPKFFSTQLGQLYSASPKFSFLRVLCMGWTQRFSSSVVTLSQIGPSELPPPPGWLRMPVPSACSTKARHSFFLKADPKEKSGYKQICSMSSTSSFSVARLLVVGFSTVKIIIPKLRKAKKRRETLVHCPHVTTWGGGHQPCDGLTLTPRCRTAPRQQAGSGVPHRCHPD